MRNIFSVLCNDCHMIDTRSGSTNGIPFENQLEPLRPFSATSLKDNPFVRVVILIILTITVFILLIAGTATTAISYPPEPPKWKLKPKNGDNEDLEVISVITSLDGDYKLIGPLLLMAGIFLFIVDASLCFIVIRDVYYTSRSIRPSMDLASNSVSVLGGPFFLAVPNPNALNQHEVTPFAYSRQLWAMPNAPAPTPDFTMDGCGLKGSGARPRTATLEKSSQPPFNPDVDEIKSSEK